MTGDGVDKGAEQARDAPFPDGERIGWQQARDHLTAGKPIILPWGAYEQHGPHLPLATDTAMAAELARRLAARFGAWLLPAIGYGETANNAGFPGTLSLSFDTVRAILLDLCAALARHGARRLIVVNGDFGNQAPLKLAARQARQQCDVSVLIVDYPGLEQAAAEVLETRPAAPGFYHADEFETSVMLAAAPDSVRMDRAAPEYPRFPPTYPALFAELDTISASGVFGDPRPASAEKGRALLDALTRQAATLITEFLAETNQTTSPPRRPE
jgi:creatinine amidohydrolase